MTKSILRRILSALLVLCLVGTAGAANFLFDLNGNGKTDVADLQQVSGADQEAALDEALGGGDELHKNADGQWEIWSSLGLFNMAQYAEAGDTFVLMQDVDMKGVQWTPAQNFNGKLLGNKHTISNLLINESVDGNMGLFASIAKEGSVEWLNLADVNMIADAQTENIGLIAGTSSGTIHANTAIGFITDYRNTLAKPVKIGGFVGKLENGGKIETDVENMLFADPNDEIPNISAQVGTNFATITEGENQRTFAIVGESKGSVDPMTALQNLTGSMMDPNCLAWVQNGEENAYPHSLTELLAEICSDGNSVVTLQADLYANNAAITIPYTSTWDLNGYTVYGRPDGSNCMVFQNIGSDNKITTVKNGTIHHYEMGIRVNKGGVVVKNVKLYGKNAPCVGIYDADTAYNNIHLIEDCEMYNGKWGVTAFNAASSDFSNVNLTIRNSKLVSYVAKGSELFVHRSGSTPGNIILGYDVEMYSYGTQLSSGSSLEGYAPVKTEGTETLVINGETYSGLTHWTTNQSVISTSVIAEITNNGQTTQVTNVADMVAAVQSDGNTTIKLVDDIIGATQIKLPYSCTLDMNGHTISNTQGNALQLVAVGSKNTVTTIKNGTINHSVVGVRVNTGSVQLSNVNFYATASGGACVAFYDPDPVYRADNLVDGCYFYNPNYYCITFNVANTDFSNTGVTVTNSTLIATNQKVFGTASDATSGVVTLGEHVDMYGAEAALGTNRYRYAGLTAGLTENVTIQVKDMDVEHTLNYWSTDNQNETVNILLIGNSLSTTVPEELYQIAKAAGINVTVTDLYHAGRRIWHHLEFYENKAEEYEYRVYNDMGFWFHGDIKTSNEAFEYRDWDFVSLQDFFTMAHASDVESALKNHEADTDTYVGIMKKHFPNAKLFYFEHWAWQVGQSTIPDTETQKAFQAVINETSHYLANKHDMTLIPVGEAFALAREDERIGDTLCKPDDNLHDNGPTGGQYLNGCVFFEVMFQTSCIGDTWRGSNAPSEEIHIIMQQHAHNAVAAVYGEDFAKSR